MEHIARLRAAGCSLQQVADDSGIHLDSVSLIARGQRLSISRNTEYMLLHVPIPEGFIQAPSRRQGKQRIPNVGTRRRLQALAVHGYTLEHLASELGVTVTPVAAWIQKDYVAPESARRVAELFDRLQMVPGPSQRASKVALGKGWAPPFAWDEDSIDDPDASPAKAQRSAVKPHGWWHAEFWELRDMGITDLGLIADRIGLERKTVERQVFRWQRKGIAT